MIIDIVYDGSIEKYLEPWAPPEPLLVSRSSPSPSPPLARPAPIVVPIVDGVVYDGSEEIYFEPQCQSPTGVLGAGQWYAAIR